MDLTQISKTITDLLIQVGFKVVGAIIVYVAGRWLIGLVVRLLQSSLLKQKVDSTLINYLTNIVEVAANIALVVALLGYFGVETTTFAAFVAAAGVAIGAAWSGLLANFAAGAFIIVLRPFKVGDFVSVGGVVGTVKEIGLFVTTIDTPDNIQTFIGNNKVFGDNIQNFSANAFRRVELVAQLGHGVDSHDAMTRLNAALVQIPNVLKSPAPDVEILEFNAAGALLVVRPYCNNANYWQVYFDTNKLIQKTFGDAGYPVPAQQVIVRNTP
jgi:small conductance mechanosensitive channel